MEFSLKNLLIVAKLLGSSTIWHSTFENETFHIQKALLLSLRLNILKQTEILKKDIGNGKYDNAILSIEIFPFNALHILAFSKMRCDFLFFVISKRLEIQISDLQQTIRNSKRFQSLT